MEREKLNKEIERIVYELGTYTGDYDFIADIQNGYNNTFNDSEGKVHTYSEIRILAENNIEEGE